MRSAKIFLAMIFNEIECHVNTSLGLVGDASPLVSAPGDRHGRNFVVECGGTGWCETNIL